MLSFTWLLYCRFSFTQWLILKQNINYSLFSLYESIPSAHSMRNCIVKSLFINFDYTQTQTQWLKPRYGSAIVRSYSKHNLYTNPGAHDTRYHLHYVCFIRRSKLFVRHFAMRLLLAAAAKRPVTPYTHRSTYIFLSISFRSFISFLFSFFFFRYFSSRLDIIEQMPCAIRHHHAKEFVHWIIIVL